MKLILSSLVIVQTCSDSFTGVNLRHRPFEAAEPLQRSSPTVVDKKETPSKSFSDSLRPPFDYGVQRSALGNEIQEAINMAPLRSFSDPQTKMDAIAGSIPSSQPVLVSCEFQNEWTAASHPTDYPTSNAHWSPIVFASHSSGYQMWSYGALASPGVREVAEVSTEALMLLRSGRNELNNVG